MTKPKLYCIHNRDWPTNPLTGNPLYGPTPVYHNALVVNGTPPEDGLQDEVDRIRQDAG